MAWDLYNEPGSPTTRSKSLPLLPEVFRWAREVGPSQPLTAGVYNRQFKEIDATLLANSDVITFHNYGDRDFMIREIADLTQTGRPLICTEWMNRPLGSTIGDILPLLFEDNVGSFFWGLVNGKTQTNYRWGSKAGDPSPRVWQHDIFHGDLTPYDDNEIALLRKYIQMSISAPKR